MKRSPLLPIFLVVLVDILGFTMVYPLLPFYAEKFGATPFLATSLVAVYAVCSLLSTPVIGRLSDKYGRRRMLLISQAGTFAGFLVIASAQSLWMLYLGRILDGVTAGNLSIAQAYISDHTEAKDRSRAFGVIGIAFGIGFMFGPAMAGMLQKYGMYVPFFVAAGLSLTSMVCSFTLLEPGAPGAVDPASPIPQATATGPGGRRPGLFDIKTYLEFFGRPGLGAIYLQFFCFSFAFSAFMSGFALFAERRFVRADGGPWTAREVGYLLAYSGLLGMILQGGILGRLVKKLGEPPLIVTGFITAIAAYLMLGAAHTLLLIMTVSTISAYGNGVLRPVLTSQITQQVSRYEQGVAIGISSSLSSLAMAIAPLIGGWLITESWMFEWTLIPTGAALLGLIVALVKRNKIESVKATAT